MDRIYETHPEIKDFFWGFHQLKDFFYDYGSTYVLKYNEFYNIDKFEEFRTTVQMLTEFHYIEPVSSDQTNIYLYQMHDLRPQFQIARIYRLTDKGKELIELLPAREDVDNLR